MSEDQVVDEVILIKWRNPPVLYTQGRIRLILSDINPIMANKSFIFRLRFMLIVCSSVWVLFTGAAGSHSRGIKKYPTLVPLC